MPNYSRPQCVRSFNDENNFNKTSRERIEVVSAYYYRNQEEICQKQLEYSKKNKVKRAEYDKLRYDWHKSWGDMHESMGTSRNNLLLISLGVFH